VDAMVVVVAVGVADSVVVAVDSMSVAPDVAAVAAEAVVVPDAAVASRSASFWAVVSEAAAYRGASAVFADRRRAVGPKPSAPLMAPAECWPTGALIYCCAHSRRRF
jgi:hypothetical protein